LAGVKASEKGLYYLKSLPKVIAEGGWKETEKKSPHHEKISTSRMNVQTRGSGKKKGFLGDFFGRDGNQKGVAERNIGVRAKKMGGGEVCGEGKF